MAHTRELAKKETFGTYDLPFLYNLDGTVGWSGANRRDDVMLVQTLLNSVFGGDSIKFGHAPISGNVPGLTVDGLFGAKTAFALTLFLVCVDSPSVAQLKPVATPMLGDPLCDLQLTAYRAGPKQFYASTLLSKAPAVLTHALKTVRKS